MSCVLCKPRAILCAVHTFRTRLIRHKGYSTPRNPITAATMAKADTAEPSKWIKPQKYNYFLVLDFEATCEDGKKIKPQEVIEFPVLKVSGRTFEVESTFHQYVEPQVHRDLSPFCTQLTGIIQEMVDGQPNITSTLESFHAWMLSEGLLDPEVSSVFVTCGDWDLNIMLPNQGKDLGFTYPEYLTRWINIKKPYSQSLGKYPKGMMSMLAGLNIPHTGRHHSGIDDCTNIAAILRGLALRGVLFDETGRLQP